MQKILLIFMFLCTIGPSQGQQSQNAKNLKKEISNYKYYIYLSGVKKRSDVLFLEKEIQSKPSVTFFMADRFPVRCFILKSTKAISASEFESWINAGQYHIQVFGSEEKDKELAYTYYIKAKKLNHE